MRTRVARKLWQAPERGQSLRDMPTIGDLVDPPGRPRRVSPFAPFIFGHNLRVLSTRNQLGRANSHRGARSALGPLDRAIIRFYPTANQGEIAQTVYRQTLTIYVSRTGIELS